VDNLIKLKVTQWTSQLGFLARSALEVKSHPVNMHNSATLSAKPNVQYALAKFQSSMPIILGVTVLQSGNSKKINLYSKHWENKLQVLTKMDVT